MSSSHTQNDARNDDTLRHFQSRAKQARTNTQGTHLPGNARVTHDSRVGPPSRAAQPVYYEYGMRAGQDNFVPFSTISAANRNKSYSDEASGRKFNNTFLMRDSFYGDNFRSSGPYY
jgi:hypothetical protein